MTDYVRQPSETGHAQKVSRQLRQMATARVLDNATIGSARILDTSGNVVAVLGLQADGTYGLTMLNPAGQSVSLSQLAFGNRTVTDNSEIDFRVAAGGGAPLYSNNTWNAAGPALSGVQVQSGSLRVFVTANMNVSVGPGTMYMTVALTGPTLVAESIPLSLACDYQGVGMASIVQASREIYFTGLTPGVYTVTASYNLISAGSPQAAAIVTNRSVSAQPF